MKTVELTDLECKALWLCAAEGMSLLMSDYIKRDQEFALATVDAVCKVYRAHSGHSLSREGL